MPQEGTFLHTGLTRVTSIQQGTGVIGQLAAVMIAAIAVIGIAVYCITPNRTVTISVLVVVLVLVLFVLGFVFLALKFANDHPEYASLAGQHTVAALKAQGSRQSPALNAGPGANIAPPTIEAVRTPPKIEDQSGEAAQ